MSDAEQLTETLLGRADRRREAPPDVRDRVFQAVEAEWRSTSRARSRWPIAAVAAVVLAAFLAGALNWERTDPFAVQIAATRGLVVDKTRYTHGGTQIELTPGTAMVAERTSRLTGANGTEFRLRAGSAITWNSEHEIRIDAGAVYVDTHGGSGMRFETPAGTVEDIGTRFMVTVGSGQVEVAMRDGAVRMTTSHGINVARAASGVGDVLVVDNTGARKILDQTSVRRWDWILEAHPGYQETSVSRLLEAIARDLGLELEYLSPDVKAVALDARMVGDLGELQPNDALEVVLATNGLRRLETSPGRLVIDLPAHKQPD